MIKVCELSLDWRTSTEVNGGPPFDWLAWILFLIFLIFLLIAGPLAWWLWHHRKPKK